MRKLACLAAILAVTAPQRTAAWWLTGHTVINRTGVATLPADVPEFLKRQIDWIGARSIVPDSWRDATEPSLRAVEIPNHIWYFEALPPMPLVPRSRNDFIIIAGDPRRIGTLPYAMIENYERLKVAFRAWRGLHAKQRGSPASSRWMRRSTSAGSDTTSATGRCRCIPVLTTTAGSVRTRRTTPATATSMAGSKASSSI